MIEGTFIKFVPGPSKPKTGTWRVVSRETEVLLGVVAWYGPWRKYSFHPEGWTVFEQKCLREIADFCERQTAEHKKVRAAHSEHTRALSWPECDRDGLD